MSTNYFPASDVLPPDLIARILTHLPPERRERVLLYIHPDPFVDRDAKITAAFERALREDGYPTLDAVYDALAEEFALSTRRIWAIVRYGRSEPALCAWQRRNGRNRPKARQVRRAPTAGRRHFPGLFPPMRHTASAEAEASAADTPPTL